MHAGPAAAESCVHFPSCRMWDVNDGSVVNTLAHHSDSVLCLRFKSDIMVTGSRVLCEFVPTYTYMYSSNQRWDMNGLLPP